MKIVIVGKSASGKDHLKDLLKKRGFKASVSHTTRPPRKGEVNGIDYHFIDVDTFKKMADAGEFLEYAEFNGWFYGQTIEEFEQAELMIKSKEGLAMLSSSYRKQCMVIYLDIDRKIRAERLNQRKDFNDRVDRRLLADDEQFKDFLDFEIRITNPNF
jgi:guanylate kinase